jgi:hypothetical protein
VFYDPSTSSGGEAHQPYRLAELELHDVRPRREGDQAAYVDNSQVASWLAELELTDLERKAYILDGPTQDVSVLSSFPVGPLAFVRPSSRLLLMSNDRLGVTQVDKREAQIPVKAKRTTLTHRQVASVIFGIVNNDPSPNQSQLPPKDLELFQQVARLLQQPVATE